MTYWTIAGLIQNDCFISWLVDWLIDWLTRVNRLSATLPFTVEDAGDDEDVDEKVAAKVRAANVIMPAFEFRNATQEAENLIKKLLVRQPE